MNIIYVRDKYKGWKKKRYLGPYYEHVKPNHGVKTIIWKKNAADNENVVVWNFMSEDVIKLAQRLGLVSEYNIFQRQYKEMKEKEVYVYILCRTCFMNMLKWIMESKNKYSKAFESNT